MWPQARAVAGAMWAEVMRASGPDSQALPGVLLLSLSLCSWANQSDPEHSEALGDGWVPTWKEPSSLGRHVCTNCQICPGTLREQVINFEFKSLTFLGAVVAISIIYVMSTQDGMESSSWGCCKGSVS